MLLGSVSDGAAGTLKADTLLTVSEASTDPYCITGSSCLKNLDFTQRAS